MTNHNVSAAIRKTRRIRAGLISKSCQGSIGPGRKIRTALVQGSPDYAASKIADICDTLEPGDAIMFVVDALTGTIEVFASIDDATIKRSSVIKYLISSPNAGNYAVPGITAAFTAKSTMGIFIEWRRVIMKSRHMRYGNIEWAKLAMVFVNGQEYALERITMVKKVS